jgi:CBS domain-containing protein
MTASEKFFRYTTGEAMRDVIVTCEPDTPLVEVAALMADHRIHCVVVTEADSQTHAPWALVSDLDLAAAAIEGIEGRVARQVSATPVVTVTSGEPLWRAAQLMTEHANPHLVVVDEATNRPVGILSTLDVAAVAAQTVTATVS